MKQTDYRALLPNWWSQAWAQHFLQKFSNIVLAQAYIRLSERKLSVLSIAGTGPAYAYFDEWKRIKLRFKRFKPAEKNRIRTYLSEPPDWTEELRSGSMSRALWDQLCAMFFPLPLSENDVLTGESGVKEAESEILQAALVLCLAWFVSCDPAYIFVWRGFDLYGELKLQPRPLRPLPSGAYAARHIWLPGKTTSFSPAEPAAADRFDAEDLEIINRHATRPWARAWLESALPAGADLKAAETLSPALCGFSFENKDGHVQVTAKAPAATGKPQEVRLVFDQLSYSASSRLIKFFESHEEDCHALAENRPGDDVLAVLENYRRGFFSGSRDKVESGVEGAALALRAAEALSKYPRLMVLWRGIDLLAIDQYLKRTVFRRLVEKSRKKRGRDEYYDSFYDDFGPDFGSDELCDIKTPAKPDHLPPDSPGGEPWAQRWLYGFGVRKYDDFVGWAKAALREGRLGDFVYDGKKSGLGCELANVWGEKQHLSLHFEQLSAEQRNLIRAMMCLYPQYEKELKAGTISVKLQELLKKFGIRILPDNSERASDRREQFTSGALAMIIKATQLLSADPLRLFSWRGLDPKSADFSDPSKVTAESLLALCAPSGFAGRFIKGFLKAPQKETLIKAAACLSEKRVGAPEPDFKGHVRVSCRLAKGKKQLSLGLKPFTCAQVSAIAGGFDREYGLLCDLSRGDFTQELKDLLAKPDLDLLQGKITEEGSEEPLTASSDPLALAALLRITCELSDSPGLLFEWRGLPLLSVPLGQIRACLADKAPDEPFALPKPPKADKYLQETFDDYGFQDQIASDCWWKDKWQNEVSQAEYFKLDAKMQKEIRSLKVGDLISLPNLRLLWCEVKTKNGTERVYMRLRDYDGSEKGLIRKFFKERPELAAALGQGCLDRSFWEYARSERIDLWHRYGERVSCQDKDVYCRDSWKGAFILKTAEALSKDPLLLFLWRGLDLKRDLGIGKTGAALQQGDEQALRELHEAAAPKGGRRGKAAAGPESNAASLIETFGRRMVVNLAEDAVTGFMRDSKASRIDEAEFDQSRLSAHVDVWHGRSSCDEAVLTLAPLSESDKKTVISELRADPHALAQLQAGRLDEAFAKKLSERGIPLSCGDSPVDLIKCSCETSAHSVCRHELALLCRAAQLVKSDPALLFEMRGFDIKAELKKLGALSGAASAWMKAQTLLTIHPELDARDDQDKTPEDALHHLNRVSFAKVPSGLLHSAFRLLATSPSGYAGDDCKAALLKTLDCARQCVRSMIKSDIEITSLPDFTASPAEIGEDGRLRASGKVFARFKVTRESADPKARDYLCARLRLLDKAELDLLPPEKAAVEIKTPAYESDVDDHEFVQLHSLISGCFNGKISAQVLEDSGLAGEALYALCSIARKLVLADAIMPCPLRLSPEKLCVIWIPCLLSHEVLTLTARVGMLAKRLVLGSVFKPGKELKAEKLVFSDAGFGALCLGLFISDLVRKGFLMNLGLAVSVWNRTLANTPELMLMTLSYWENLNLCDAAMQRMDSSLGQWLAPMFLGLTGMRPVLILGTSFEPDLSIDAAEEKLRAGGEQALDEEKTAEGEREITGANAQPEADDSACAEISLGFIDRSDGRYLSYGEVAGLGAQKRGECRAAAARIAGLLPEAAGIVSGESDHAELSLEALQKALFEILPALKLSGALVVLPRSMRRILRPRAVANLKLGRGYKGGNGLMSLAALLSFDWKAALGGREITEEQFAALEKHAGHLVRFGNDFVFASPDEIDAIIKRLRGRAQRPSRLKLLEAALSGSCEGDEVFMDGKIREAIQKELRTPPAKVPEGLAATLRPYQERGYSWLMHNLRARMGSVIADDMGLGKTVQVIAALEALREAGELDENPALVAVPASVVINWEREIKRFAPKLTVSVYYGTERSLKQKAQVLLTTYGTLRQDIDKIKELKWRVAVADEAQNIKNPLSQIFRDMCALKADSAIAMTGTPVENRLADYWAIMEFVNPGLFGTLGSFTAGYAQPIERERDAEAARRLRDVTAPFILRRLKTDKNVIADLPDKLSADRFCELTPEQAAMYQSFVTDGLRGVTETLTPIERSAQVLRLILRLKQICDAPELFSKDPRISGPAHSGKAQALLDLLQELCENGRKAIVFTQFREMGDLLVSWIGERLGTAPDFIHGGVSVKKRQEMVDRFQNDPRDRVMVLSLKAAGTGLNLTAAAAVVHYDLWWNPAVEDQATDRAYRIGQDKNVEVYRFICAGTFEEKINEMIRSKKEIAELTVQKGEKWLGDLSKSELKSFLSMSAG